LIVDDVATSMSKGSVESAGDAMMIAAGDIATATSTCSTGPADTTQSIEFRDYLVESGVLTADIDLLYTEPEWAVEYDAAWVKIEQLGGGGCSYHSSAPARLASVSGSNRRRGIHYRNEAYRSAQRDRTDNGQQSAGDIDKQAAGDTFLQSTGDTDTPADEDTAQKSAGDTDKPASGDVSSDQTSVVGNHTVVMQEGSGGVARPVPSLQCRHP
jgi:hypothetical protein